MKSIPLFAAHDFTIVIEAFVVAVPLALFVLNLKWIIGMYIHDLASKSRFRSRMNVLIFALFLLAIGCVCNIVYMIFINPAS